MRTAKSVAERDLGSDDLFLNQKSGIVGEDCAHLYTGYCFFSSDKTCYSRKIRLLGIMFELDIRIIN